MEPEIQEMKTYRFLVIGKIGDGKSSICRFLTGLDKIQISSRTTSCTIQCQLYRSIDRINQKRGYAIQVIDTPGLDSNQQYMLKILMQLAEILRKLEYLNGILYTINISQSRDVTISWLFNFLKLYFTNQQLAKGIIPILTNYDKVLYQDDKKLDEMKNSRKQAISKLFQNQQQVDNLWGNYLQWINDAKQKQKLTKDDDFKKIYQHQLTKLINKAGHIKLSLLENTNQFQTKINKNLLQEFRENKEQYKMTAQSIKPIKFKTCLKDLSWEILDKIDQDSFQKMSLYLQMWWILGHYEKFIQQGSASSFNINKILESLFRTNFLKHVIINHSQSPNILVKNDWFVGNKHYIHINLTEDQFWRIETLQLARKNPKDGKYDVIQKKKQIMFQDSIGAECEITYQFRNIKILRPDDQFINEILTRLIRNQ